MYSWKKLGRVFDPTQISGRPWLKEFAQAPAALVMDDVVRVYFSCRPPRDANGQYASYTAFVDLDRRDPTKVIRVADKPILPLGGLGCFDEFGTYPTSVIEHNGNLLAYYGGWTRCESVPFNVGIGCARSFDGGETFEKLGIGPVLPYTPDEPFVLSGPKIRRFDGKLVLFYIAGRKWIGTGSLPEPVYKIRMATSADGVLWHKADADLIPSRIEEDEAQASPDVIFANNKYHMFFCYRYSTDYRNASRGYRIGYASSEDLSNWTRADHLAGITPSAEGWDSESISYPHVFELDGTIYMAYLGNQVGRFGFGLARLEGKL
jgi:hypothetical protein